MYAFAADIKYEKEIATFYDQKRLIISKHHARKRPACFCPYTTNCHGRFVCTTSMMLKLPLNSPAQELLKRQK